MKKTSIFENGLIWFGAALSLAEIQTGTYFASLGFTKGLFAVIIGHIIGCILLFSAGVIGGKTGKSSMDSAKMSFGFRGATFFALLNVFQLVAWTSIMIYDGALAANEIFRAGHWLWCILIGALILLWIIIGVKNLGKLNTVAMTALFLLTLALSVVLFRNTGASLLPSDAISFGAAVELSAAMPISWLPLISDYTRESKSPVAATAVSVTVYGIVSCWMYLIGMGAAIITGESDIAKLFVSMGFGTFSLIIIVFSTVTTTFLDAYSAGVSSESLSKKINGKWVAIGSVILGSLGAIFLPLHDITDFLYFIGSVFTPMIAIQITDYFILNNDSECKAFDIRNLTVWFIGFISYRILMRFDIIIGSTLPDIFFTIIICVVAGKFTKELSR